MDFVSLEGEIVNTIPLVVVLSLIVRIKIVRIGYLVRLRGLMIFISTVIFSLLNTFVFKVCKWLVDGG